MRQELTFRHEFVEFIPDEMHDGVLFISIRFATASHLCPCGCRNKVVTPLRPTDWMLIFDGKTISLHPSIGNWSFPCRSHYFIRLNRVRWAVQWSQERIDAARDHDRLAKDWYLAGIAEPDLPSMSPQQPETMQPVNDHVYWL